jgi:hypothetical protein
MRFDSRLCTCVGQFRAPSVATSYGVEWWEDLEGDGCGVMEVLSRPEAFKENNEMSQSGHPVSRKGFEQNTSGVCVYYVSARLTRSLN